MEPVSRNNRINGSSGHPLHRTILRRMKLSLFMGRVYAGIVSPGGDGTSSRLFVIRGCGGWPAIECPGAAAWELVVSSGPVRYIAKKCGLGLPRNSRLHYFHRSEPLEKVVYGQNRRTDTGWKELQAPDYRRNGTGTRGGHLLAAQPNRLYHAGRWLREYRLV